MFPQRLVFESSRAIVTEWATGYSNYKYCLSEPIGSFRHSMWAVLAFGFSAVIALHWLFANHHGTLQITRSNGLQGAVMASSPWPVWLQKHIHSVWVLLQERKNRRSVLKIWHTQQIQTSVGQQMIIFRWLRLSSENTDKCPKRFSEASVKSPKCCFAQQSTLQHLLKKDKIIITFL